MLGRLRLGMLAAVAVLTLAGPTNAQDQGQNLADIQAELTVLNGQIEQLRNELVRSGAAGGLPVDAATALTRLDQLEAELRRLTDRVDVLTNDVIRITEDASNRVGDIEFRLTELEGGDTSVRPEPSLLGGGVTRPRPRPIAPAVAPEGSGALAVSEQGDFDAAVAAAESGDNARAATLFSEFLQDYPGGPLTTEAQYRRGEALAATEDWRGAARSFLDAFSGAPQDPQAPNALFQLAVSLGKLGQVSEACLTLTEVDTRYPGSAVAGDVAVERQALACP
jgi:tol-pal system protein YbgF